MVIRIRQSGGGEREEVIFFRKFLSHPKIWPTKKTAILIWDAFSKISPSQKKIITVLFHQHPKIHFFKNKSSGK